VLFVGATVLLGGEATSHALPKLNVGVFLRPPAAHLKALQSRAKGVSDPASQLYGQYRSQAELAKDIGVDPKVANGAAEWLRGALGQDSQASIRVVSHGDAVAASVRDFRSTYLLGASIVGADVGGIEASQPMTPPAGVELVLTPPMPAHYCKHLNQSSCLVNPPCSWKPLANHSHVAVNEAAPDQGRCRGDFAGWICWQESLPAAGLRARWRCYEPDDLEGMNQTAGSGPWQRDVRKRRRRGRSVDKALLEAQGSSQAPSLGNVASPRLNFRVAPRSEGLLLLFKMDPDDTIHWNSVEISWRQQGLFHSRVVLRKDFSPHGQLHAATISGVTNLRRVDQIAVCLGGQGASASEEVAAAVASAAAEAGCACDPSSGRDKRLGRLCEPLSGLSPRITPVDFVVPRTPQTLSLLDWDLDVHADDPAGGASSSVAVGEFSFETFLEKDVINLRESYGLRAPASNITVVGIQAQPGEPDNADTGGEGSLDLQAVSVMSPGAPLTWWSVSPYDMDGFMMAYAVQVNDAEDPPLVHSISWGDAEALFPPAFVERLDYELMKLALRGITVLVASGDNGISATTPDCAFVPDLVGSSPWITSVGATMPSLASAPYCNNPSMRRVLGTCSEPGPITCSVASGAVITSSGYWSIYRSEPEYQSRAVKSYLHNAECAPCNISAPKQASVDLSTPCQHLSSTHTCALHPLLGSTRASPDVALPGNSYPTLINDTLSLFDGTSASAPAFAAMISLLNAEQSRRGQPPLGLLNPWLYSVHAAHPEAFTDVVVGDTGSTEDSLCTWGFRAAPGWDPATGLGEPRLAVLRKLLPQQRAAAGDEQREGHAIEERLSGKGLLEEPVARIASGTFLWAITLAGAAATLLAWFAIFMARGHSAQVLTPVRSLAAWLSAAGQSGSSHDSEAGYRALLGRGDAQRS